ncbi:MAG: hypothetical protein QHJ73_07900, partial [Armatimonadota bacterium]|nr:hypothetical protein [Armatimonadota bacterium]
MHLLTALLLTTMLGATPPENLAAGKRVQFVPAPNYNLTAKGGTDETDLTDGVLSDRQDQRLWFDSKAVGFSYPGLQQLAVDLGSEQSIGEVAVRFLGGSFQPGLSFPVWVDVVASRDGRRYFRVASFSRWNEGDRVKFNVPPENGTAWVHRLAFQGLRFRARYVGLSFYGAGLAATDELWVLRGPADAPPLAEDPASAAPFTVEAPQLYFHKPVVHFSTNIATPNPVGVLCARDTETPVQVRLELPSGVRLLEGSNLGGTGVEAARREELADGRLRYVFSAKVRGSQKNWGRLYLAATWPNNREGEIHYQVRAGEISAPEGRQRLRAVRVVPAPRPKRLLTGMGWWSLEETREWPNAEKAFTTLGFSYVPLFPRWVRENAQ